MSIDLSYIIAPGSITVNYNGETNTVLKGTKQYDAVLLALKEGRKDDVPAIVSPAETIKDYSNGNFDVKNGVLYLKDNPRSVPAALAKKILEFKDEGLPYVGLIEFAKNLLKNPSYRSVEQLFQFLEANRHPITDDGCFIAYKAVQKDFLDKYTKTMDNSPGNVVKMPRNEVDEDPNRTCSRGIHCANYQYSSTIYGNSDDVMIEVKVNPEHVVAVPVDYNNAKMRVCEYLVLGVVKNERKSSYVDSATGRDWQNNDSPRNDTQTELEEEEDEDENEDETRYCYFCSVDLNSGVHDDDCPQREFNDLAEKYGTEVAEVAMKRTHSEDDVQQMWVAYDR